MRRVLLALGLPLVGVLVFPASALPRLLATLQQPGVLLGVPSVPAPLLGVTIFGLSESVVVVGLVAVGVGAVVIGRRRQGALLPYDLLVICLGLVLGLTLIPANPVYRWRLSLYAWLPATLLVAVMYDRVLVPLMRMMGYGSRGARPLHHAFATLTIAVIVVAAAVTGFSGAVLAAHANPAQAGFEPQLQRGVFDAMVWMRDQVPDRGVGVLSMGLAPFQFLPSISGHAYRDDDPLDPRATLDIAAQRRFGYVAMHALLRNQTHVFPPLFDVHPAFQRVYQNEAVIIYRIVQVSR